MTYLIDAWLDRPHPYLRILHRETGEICAVLEEDALDELRDQGGLDLHELNSSEPLILKELVRNLFLFCYARAASSVRRCPGGGSHERRQRRLRPVPGRSRTTFPESLSSCPVLSATPRPSTPAAPRRDRDSCLIHIKPTSPESRYNSGVTVVLSTAA